MRLTPTEMDRLTIFTVAELARRHRAKGWRLNHPEALAMICDEMHEAARGNRRLVFDRAPAWGRHLDIPAGDSVRWSPGEVKRVRLVAYGGRRATHGFHGLTEGAAEPARLGEALGRLTGRRFGHRPQSGEDRGP